MSRTSSSIRACRQEPGTSSSALWPDAKADQQLAGNFLEVTIGKEVRAYRRQRGITLVELARAAGLSLGMMSKIENGITSASLSTLRALSQALGVPLTALFRTFDADQQEPLFLRAGTEKPTERDVSSSGYQRLLACLGSASPEAAVVPCLVTLNRREEITLLRHPGMKLVYLLEGELGYRHGVRLYHMAPGDGLLFSAEAIHGPCKLARLPVRFVSVRSCASNDRLIGQTIRSLTAVEG